MKNISDRQLIQELLNEISELKHQIKELKIRTADVDKKAMASHISILSIINEVLAECCISVRSCGYAYIKESLCVLRSLGRSNVCFSKEVYPRVAEILDIGSTSSIEHAIRNCLNQAYLSHCRSDTGRSSIMSEFDKSPSSKKFLIRAASEVCTRMALADL